MVRLGPAAVAAAAFTSALVCAGASSANTLSVNVRSTLATACSETAIANAGSQDALETCSRALQEEPLTTRDRAATYVNRGVIHLLQGDYRSAFNDFDHAVAMNAGLGEALVDRGIARVAMGQVAEGIADLNQGLAMGLATPEHAYYHRAVARERLNDARGAYLDYRKAAELNPRWRTPRQEMARFTLTRSR